MEFANKSQFCFAGNQSFVNTSTGDIYETPDPMVERLGDFARLSFITGEFKFQLDASDGEYIVKLMAGEQELASEVVIGSDSAVVPVDVAEVSGQTALTVLVECTTAGSGTASLYAALTVTSPLVIGLA